MDDTGVDRCDGCLAAAVVRVRLASGSALVLCGHHGRQHAAALRARGAVLSGDLDLDSHGPVASTS